MYVDEKTAEFKATVRGTTYYFCSHTCMKEFLAPEVEIRKLKISVAVCVILTVPIIILTYVPLLSTRINYYILFALIRRFNSILVFVSTMGHTMQSGIEWATWIL